MPFTCDVNAHLRRATITLTGAVDVQTAIEALACYRHPDWRPDFQALWDTRGVTGLSVAPDDLDRFTEELTALAPLLGEGRSAFVVPDEVHRGIAHLIFRRQPPAGRVRRVFRTMEKALAWLDEERT